MFTLLLYIVPMLGTGFGTATDSTIHTEQTRDNKLCAHDKTCFSNRYIVRKTSKSSTNNVNSPTKLRLLGARLCRGFRADRGFGALGLCFLLGGTGARTLCRCGLLFADGNRFRLALVLVACGSRSFLCCCSLCACSALGLHDLTERLPGLCKAASFHTSIERCAQVVRLESPAQLGLNVLANGGARYPAYAHIYILSRSVKLHENVQWTTNYPFRLFAGIRVCNASRTILP